MIEYKLAAKGWKKLFFFTSQATLAQTYRCQRNMKTAHASLNFSREGFKKSTARKNFVDPLRTVPTKYKGIFVRLVPSVKSRS